MNLEPIIILVLVGAVGGAARAVLGFEVQSDTGEKFNWVKAVKSVVRAAIAGSLVVYSTVDETVPITGAKIFIGAFFTSVGADVLLKEFYGSVKTALTKKEG